MCGINGFVDYQGKLSREMRHAMVHEMNERILYRGPDAEGIYDGDWLSMGMRRLAIIDLYSGNQPIYNADRTVVIVFNGEIYNYRLLKQELVKRGHRFVTESDTEVIVHLYDEYGTQAFKKLDGMFAFSLFDRSKQKLYIVRDRLGEKPLYYTRQNGVILYGSELKSLLATNFVAKNINIKAMTFYFQYSYIPAPFAIFENVFKLQPGHFLEIDQMGSFHDEQYWDIKINPELQKLSYIEACEELRRKLRKSVELRMHSDVHNGAFLSGGLDSGIIAALMAQQSREPIKTFTIGFAEQEYDESENAAILAQYIGAEHHICKLGCQDSLNIISKVIDKLDEPFGDSSILPEYLVCNFAAQSVKVALTGDAGDELFFGYEKYLINYYADKYMQTPHWLRKGLLEPIVNFLPDTNSLSRKVNKVIDSAYMDVYARRNRTMQLGFKDEEICKLLRQDVLDMSGQQLVCEHYNHQQGTELNRTQYTDLKVVLEGDMLTKVDRISMLNSLETRAPLLANDIVELAVSLPDDYKLDGRNKKKILKETFMDMLPRDYSKLPKSGFAVPLDYWFRNEMKADLIDTLNYNRIQSEGLLEPVYVQKIMQDHFTGKVNRKSELWNLYIFEKWYMQYM